MDKAVKSKTALDQTSLNLTEQVPYLEVEVRTDEPTQQENIKAKAAIIIDPSNGKTFGTAYPMPIQAVNAYVLPVALQVFSFGSATNEAIRTPSTFKTGSATLIGSTALWTPAAGKKFRILGFTVFLPSSTTSVAGSTITLKDGAATVFTIAVIGTTTAVIAYNSGFMQNGYISTAANNVLNIDLSAALTAGSVTVNVWGSEE